MSKYDITPKVEEIWRGIGGHFDSITQVISEFIDNSISNIITTGDYKQIFITINKRANSKLKITIEDTGNGIQSIEKALTIGDKVLATSSLNEHGFGLKHALATADTENKHWKILTRTKDDYEKERYKVVEAPYSFHMDDRIVDNKKEPWPGKHSGSGTIIEFECTQSLFKSVVAGIGGDPTFETELKYLRDDLGYIYSGYIKDNNISIRIDSDEIENPIDVKMLEPEKVGEFDPKPKTRRIDLGNGEVDFSYKFLDVKDRAEDIGNDEIKGRYYRKNQKSQGLEIRVNGRLMMDNLMEEVWHTSTHPGYNHFLAQVNIVSDDINKLPKTRTSKNGIRIGDEKLEKIFSEVKKMYPNINKRTTNKIRENELVNELKETLEAVIIDESKNITTEFTCFECFDAEIKADMYVYDGNKVRLYEAKKDNADIMSLYQLRAYWDGLVMDNIDPDIGILVSSSFSPGVDDLIDWLNNQKDPKGNKYNIIKQTWQDNKIDYPVK